MVHLTMQRSLVGSLRYLCNTRPYLAYSVGIVSRSMQEHTMSHMVAIKRILKYIKGTTSLCCHYNRKRKNHQHLWDTVIVIQRETSMSLRVHVVTCSSLTRISSPGSHKSKEQLLFHLVKQNTFLHHQQLVRACGQPVLGDLRCKEVDCVNLKSKALWLQSM